MALLSENRICDLPDDLLLLILRRMPTKDAVATPILSKRWRHVWTMLPELVFEDQDQESHGWFVDKSLQLHKAKKLLKLDVELGPCCSSVDVDVEKWVEKAVKGGVKELNLNLRWGKADPTSFPKSLYICDTLVDLTLSNEILVDVSSPACLPSLLYLTLEKVVYKDDDSFVKLLSSCPVLWWLYLVRHEDDKLTNFTVKVTSLETFAYKSAHRVEVKDEVEREVEEDEVDVEVEVEVEVDVDVEVEVEVEVEEDEYDDLNGSLVIDSPALTELQLTGCWEEYCLIENMPCLDVADTGVVLYLSDNFLTSLSSVMHLKLILTEAMITCCYNAITFSWLIEFYFTPDESTDWLDPLMFLLQNSPKLKSLTIDTYWYKRNTKVLPPSWNQPNSIPDCLSSHLDILRWRGYGGSEDQKQLISYILANSKCLKTAEISFTPDSNPEERQKEIESMLRISTSSQFLFPTRMNLRFNGSVRPELT